MARSASKCLRGGAKLASLALSIGLLGAATASADTQPGASLGEITPTRLLHVADPHEEIPLPGTQKGEQGAPLEAARAHVVDGVPLAAECRSCHGNYDSAPGSGSAPEANGPYDTWSGSMMAHAWRDPLARAALAVANHDLETALGIPAGDWCTRCHAPQAWLDGKSLPADGSEIEGAGADGVTCATCHRMVDAVETTGTCVPGEGAAGFDCGGPSWSGRVDRYDNGMYVLDAGEDVNGDGQGDVPVYAGPYGGGAAPHAATGGHDAFIRRSDHCGTCHNVTNPVLDVPSEDALRAGELAAIADRLAPLAGKPMPIERTHVEWAYADGTTPSCQDCHFRELPGRAAAGATTPVRDGLSMHVAAGGNAWVPEMIPLFFPLEATDERKAQLARTAAVAREMLASAARIDVETFVEGLLVVRVTNLTGHKLPTGYPEGRRMWLSVDGRVGDEIVFRSGAYDPETAELSGSDDLGRPTKIWEILLGIHDESGAAEHTFHFALNNVILKDNRIPPSGFRHAEAAPEGAILLKEEGACDEPLPEDWRPGCEDFDWELEDGRSEGYDVVAMRLPPEVDRVEIGLHYQTASKEYVEFLGDPANSGVWADRFVAGLLPAWEATGKSPPVLMTTATASR